MGSSVVHRGPITTTTTLLNGEGAVSAPRHASSPWLLEERGNDGEEEGNLGREGTAGRRKGTVPGIRAMF
jgi:hypothetical protein